MTQDAPQPQPLPTLINVVCNNCGLHFTIMITLDTIGVFSCPMCESQQIQKDP